jgi:integrase
MDAKDTASTGGRQRKPLTDRQVDAAKPKAEAYRLSDGAGLFLIVGPSGSKVWRTIYARNGRRSLMKLGEYPAMGLAEARLARQQIRVDVAEGGDPAVDREVARAEAAVAADRTVEVVVREWHAANLSRWKGPYAEAMLARFELHVFPAIGQLPIAKVHRQHIIKLLETCRDRLGPNKQGGPSMADSVRKHLDTFFVDMLDANVVERNPAERLAKKTPVAPEPQAALTDLEGVRGVLATVESSGCGIPIKLLHRFIALTGVRLAEASGAEWGEFTVPGEWCIPAERMKGRKGREQPHTVLLSWQAAEVVEVMRALAPEGARWVFPTDGLREHRPLYPNSVSQVLRRLLGAKVHTVHGWRASMRTVLHRLHDTERDMLERMLSHVVGTKLERTYNRTMSADFEKRLRALWAEWADLLLVGAPSPWAIAGLAEPNVVQMRAAA